MKKGSLLFVTSTPPSLAGSGVAMRAGAQILAIAGMFEVTLAVLTNEGDAANPNLIGAEIRTACAEVLVIVKQSLFSTLRARCSNAILRLALAAAWPWPDRWAFNIEAMRCGAAALAGRRFDVVHCFRLHTAAILPLLGKFGIGHGRVTLDLDDHESKAAKRLARTHRAEYGRQYSLLLRLNALKWAIVESRVLGRFSTVLVCSSVDRAELSRRFPGPSWMVVPNVIPPPRAVPRTPSALFTFLFVGALDYPPNRYGIRYFCSYVLPLIRRKTDKPFRVLIVGRAPDETILALAISDEVEVVAGPPEVAPYYAQADAALAPIYSGGGTRIKIIEAFAYRLPVVSTTIGAEGLEVIANRDLLIADDPEGLANHCVSVMTDETLRRRLAVAGHALFEARYSAAVLPGLLRAALRARPTAVDENGSGPASHPVSEVGGGR